MTFNIDLYDLRRREVQALGAALSCRDWYMTEKAYNSLRDKLDNAGFTVSGPPTTPKPPAGGDAGAVEDERLTPENALAFAEQEIRHWPEGSQGQTAAIRARNLMRNLVRALALPAPVVEGWQPIETAILWDVYIVTDGEHVALAQYAESDWGGNYWAVDPEDALEWSPTHCITPPAALSEGRSHG